MIYFKSVIAGLVAAFLAAVVWVLAVFALPVGSRTMRLRYRGDRVALFLFCLVTGSVRAADAQQDRVYAGVRGVLSTQGSVKPGASPSFPTTGVGGTAVGVAGELGTSFNRTLSLAFEASVPGRFESIQETDYFSVFRTENRHRDVIFSGLFHVHVTPTGPVRVGLVAGPSVIREDTLQSTAFQLGPLGATTGNFGPFGAERPLTRWTVATPARSDFTQGWDFRRAVD